MFWSKKLDAIVAEVVDEDYFVRVVPLEELASQEGSLFVDFLSSLIEANIKSSALLPVLDGPKRVRFADQ